MPPHPSHVETERSSDAFSSRLTSILSSSSRFIYVRWSSYPITPTSIFLEIHIRLASLLISYISLDISLRALCAPRNFSSYHLDMGLTYMYVLRTHTRILLTNTNSKPYTNKNLYSYAYYFYRIVY